MTGDEQPFRLKWFEVLVASQHPAPGFAFDVLGYAPEGHPSLVGMGEFPIKGGRVVIAGEESRGAVWNGIVFDCPAEAIRAFESMS